MERIIYEKAFFAKVIAEKVSEAAKKVVFLGEDKILEAFLRKEYGIVVLEHCSFLKSEDNAWYIGDRSDKLREYFIVILSKKNDTDIAALSELGLCEFENYIYYDHDPVQVDWNVVKKNGVWTDRYGNIYTGGVIKGCTVTFSGWNGRCSIDAGARSKGTLQIVLGSNSQISLGKVIILRKGNKISATFNNEVCVEDNVRFNGTDLQLNRHEGSMEIGEGTTFGEKVVIRSCEGKVKIGKKCMFSHDVLIHETDGHSIYSIDEDNGKIQKINEYDVNNHIIIGDYCWLGARVTVLPKANLGSGSVAGACAVLKRKYPNNCIVAGNPAKVIKRNICWGRKYDVDDGRDVPAEYIRLTEENGF